MPKFNKIKMKKLSILMFAVLISAITFTGCKKKDDAPQAETKKPETPLQTPVAIYFGGTWCPPCGAYGKPAKEALKSQFNSNIVLISCQIGQDPMNNADANAFASGFGVQGVPTMYIGGNNGLINGVSGGTAMTQTCITNAQSIKDKTAVANITATASVNGENITVNTKTSFLQDQTEEYQVAVFVLESGLNHAQVSDGSANKNIHDNVLRKKLSTTVFGDVLSSNNKNGDVKEKSFTSTLDASWKKENMSVAVVLWRKNSDGKVTICNGTTVKL